MEQPKWSIVGENIDIAAFTAPCGPLPDPIPPFYTTTANVGHLADGLYLVNWRFAGGNVSNPNMPHGCFYIKKGVFENGPAVCPLPGSGVVTVTGYAIPVMRDVLRAYGITTGPDGNIWVTVNTRLDSGSRGGDIIARITPSGVVTPYAIPSELSTGVGDITAGPDGNLWFTEATGKIGKMTTDGSLTEYALPPGNRPSGITSGHDGNLWFTEPVSRKIGKMTTAGVITEYPLPVYSGTPFLNYCYTMSGVITEYVIPSSASTPSGGVVADACGITAGTDGNIWFTETTDNKIAKITPNGVITEYVVPTIYSCPSAIASGPDGNIWFTETCVNRIGKITPNGDFSEYSIPSGYYFETFRELIVAPDGSIWFTNDGIARISIVQSATPTSVPTMTAWGMIIFFLLAGLGAAVHLRRRIN
jgi:virginiamycin B lyase